MQNGRSKGTGKYVYQCSLMCHRACKASASLYSVSVKRAKKYQDRNINKTDSGLGIILSGPVT